MELRDYLKIIGKRVWILIISVVVICITTYLVSQSQPVRYEGSLSTNVMIVDANNNSVSTPIDYFRYDNYYALQSSSIFADNIVSWLKDPASVSKIYNGANVGIPADNLKDYSRLISAKKNNPAIVQINYSSKDANEVKSILASSKKFIQEKTQNLLNQNLIKNVSVDAGEPIVIAAKPNMKVNLLASLAAGIILGLLLIFFTEYMMKNKN